jgi:hypothetical protein
MNPLLLVVAQTAMQRVSRIGLRAILPMMESAERFH